MEGVGADRMGFWEEEDFIYLSVNLPRHALLGDAIQRHSLRKLQIVEFPDQREGIGTAGSEADEEEGLSRQLLVWSLECEVWSVKFEVF